MPRRRSTRLKKVVNTYSDNVESENVCSADKETEQKTEPMDVDTIKNTPNNLRISGQAKDESEDAEIMKSNIVNRNDKSVTSKTIEDYLEQENLQNYIRSNKTGSINSQLQTTDQLDGLEAKDLKSQKIIIRDVKIILEKCDFSCNKTKNKRIVSKTDTIEVVKNREDFIPLAQIKNERNILMNSVIDSEVSDNTKDDSLLSEGRQDDINNENCMNVNRNIDTDLDNSQITEQIISSIIGLSQSDYSERNDKPLQVEPKQELADCTDDWTNMNEKEVYDIEKQAFKFLDSEHIQSEMPTSCPKEDVPIKKEIEHENIYNEWESSNTPNPPISGSTDEELVKVTSMTELKCIQKQVLTSCLRSDESIKMEPEEPVTDIDISSDYLSVIQDHQPIKLKVDINESDLPQGNTDQEPLLKNIKSLDQNDVSVKLEDLQTEDQTLIEVKTEEQTNTVKSISANMEADEIHRNESAKEEYSRKHTEFTIDIVKSEILDEFQSCEGHFAKPQVKEVPEDILAGVTDKEESMLKHEKTTNITIVNVGTITSEITDTSEPKEQVDLEPPKHFNAKQRRKWIAFQRKMRKKFGQFIEKSASTKTDQECIDKESGTKQFNRQISKQQMETNKVVKSATDVQESATPLSEPSTSTPSAASSVDKFLHLMDILNKYPDKCRKWLQNQDEKRQKLGASYKEPVIYSTIKQLSQGQDTKSSDKTPRVNNSLELLNVLYKNPDKCQIWLQKQEKERKMYGEYYKEPVILKTVRLIAAHHSEQRADVRNLRKEQDRNNDKEEKKSNSGDGMTMDETFEKLSKIHKTKSLHSSEKSKNTDTDSNVYVLFPPKFSNICDVDKIIAKHFKFYHEKKTDFKLPRYTDKSKKLTDFKIFSRPCILRIPSKGVPQDDIECGVDITDIQILHLAKDAIMKGELKDTVAGFNRNAVSNNRVPPWQEGCAPFKTNEELKNIELEKKVMSMKLEIEKQITESNLCGQLEKRPKNTGPQDNPSMHEGSFFNPENMVNSFNMNIVSETAYPPWTSSSQPNASLHSVSNFQVANTVPMCPQTQNHLDQVKYSSSQSFWVYPVQPPPPGYDIIQPVLQPVPQPVFNPVAQYLIPLPVSSSKSVQPVAVNPPPQPVPPVFISESVQSLLSDPLPPGIGTTKLPEKNISSFKKNEGEVVFDSMLTNQTKQSSFVEIYDVSEKTSKWDESEQHEIDPSKRSEIPTQSNPAKEQDDYGDFCTTGCKSNVAFKFKGQNVYYPYFLKDIFSRKRWTLKQKMIYSEKRGAYIPPQFDEDGKLNATLGSPKKVLQTKKVHDAVKAIVDTDSEYGYDPPSGMRVKISVLKEIDKDKLADEQKESISKYSKSSEKEQLKPSEPKKAVTDNKQKELINPSSSVTKLFDTTYIQIKGDKEKKKIAVKLRMDDKKKEKNKTAMSPPVVKPAQTEPQKHHSIRVKHQLEIPFEAPPITPGPGWPVSMVPPAMAPPATVTQSEQVPPPPSVTRSTGWPSMIPSVMVRPPTVPQPQEVPPPPSVTRSTGWPSSMIPPAMVRPPTIPEPQQVSPVTRSTGWPSSMIPPAMVRPPMVSEPEHHASPDAPPLRPLSPVDIALEPRTVGKKSKPSAFERLGPPAAAKIPKLTVNLVASEKETRRKVVQEHVPVYLRKDMMRSKDPIVKEYLKIWPWSKPVKVVKECSYRSKDPLMDEIEMMPAYCSKSVWIKVMATGYPPDYKKEDVLDFLIKTVENREFIPCFIEFKPEYCKFLLNRSEQALTYLHNTGLAIKRGAVKINLTISQTNLTLENLRFFKGAVFKVKLNHAYDGENDALNLSEFQLQPDNSHMMYFPLNVPHNQAFLVNVIKQLLPYRTITTLNLSGNRLTKISSFSLAEHFPSLRVLDLGNNLLPTVSTLACFLGIPMYALTLDGNPLCDNFVQQDEYISVVKLIFPMLLVLDGVKVAIKMDFQRNFSISPDAQPLVDAFLEMLFTLTDSNERHLLESLYHERAVFSITCRPEMKRNPDYQDLREFYMWCRTLGDCINPQDPLEGCIVGAAKIVRYFAKWPRVCHDPYTFTVDVMQHTETHTLFKVTGLFKIPAETLSQDEPVVEFSRTFLLATQDGDEYKIMNDMMYIADSSAQRAKSAFTFVEARKVGSEGLSLDFDSSPDADLREQLVKMVMKLTKLSRSRSERCLELMQWNLQNALRYFVKLEKLDDTSLLE